MARQYDEEYPVLSTVAKIGGLVIGLVFICLALGMLIGFYLTSVGIETSCRDLKMITIFGKQYVCKPIQTEQAKAIGRKVKYVKRNVCT